MTIVCRGPAGAETFHLEEKNRKSTNWDQMGTVQVGSQWVEAAFRIKAAIELTAGTYWCRYHNGHSWSESSEPLELKVTDEDVSTPPSGLPLVPAPCLQLCPLSQAPCPPAGLQPRGPPAPLNSCPLACTSDSGLWNPGPTRTP